MRYKAFKFRAECFEDAAIFLGVAQRYIKDVDIADDAKMLEGEPDVVIEFSSNRSIDALRALAREEDDCHAIVQTLQFKETYTGERDYTITIC